VFIVSLTYIKPLEEVDANLEAHVKYLNIQYEKKNFIASGKKVPRTGGVILSKMESLEALKEVLCEDPFAKAGLAEYDIIEFIPSMTSSEFENLEES